MFAKSLFGAGALIAGRDGNEVKILVGIRPRRQKRLIGKKNMLIMRFLFSQLVLDDCWSNPFGTMGNQDEGDHRKCAVREIFEEVVLGRETSRSAADVAPHFDEWASLSGCEGVLEQIAKSREFKAKFPLVCDMRTYFVRVGKIAKPKPSPHEFPDGLKWINPSELGPEQRIHWGLAGAIHFFAQELDTLKKSGGR